MGNMRADTETIIATQAAENDAAAMGMPQTRVLSVTDMTGAEQCDSS